MYIRENIIAEERATSDGNKVTMYIYDETEYTKPEYESIVVAQTRADVDYIAIMQGVKL